MIVNLTPHAITLVNGEVTTTIPSSGVCRVTSTPGALADVGLPVPVAQPTVFGEVTGLPERQDGVFLVVSGLVAAALVATGISRPDVLVPGTGPNDGAVRDEQGRITGVTRLVRATN